MRQYAVYAGIGLLLVLVGFGAGRYSTPDKVVTVDHTQELTKDFEQKTRETIASEYEVKLQQVKQQLLAEQKENSEVHTRIERKADGSVVITKDEKTRSDTKTDSRTDTTTNTQTDKKETEKVVEYRDREVVKVVEHDKLVENAKPDWRIGVTAGVDVLDAWKGNLAPVYGGSVARRVAGPIFLGVFGDSRGVAGVGIQLDF
jgi:hypothetical protein